MNAARAGINSACVHSKKVSAVLVSLLGMCKGNASCLNQDLRGQ